MFTFMKYDNAKKLSKMTKIKKSIIKTVDLMELYDVGYDRNKYLIIATNGKNINMPHIAVKRLDFGEIVVHKCDCGSLVDSKYYNPADQEKAILSALGWLERALLD